MTTPDHSAAQYTEAICQALKARDVKAVHALLMLMALHHPREADELRQIALLGVEIANSEVPRD